MTIINFSCRSLKTAFFRSMWESKLYKLNPQLRHDACFLHDGPLKLIAFVQYSDILHTSKTKQWKRTLNLNKTEKPLWACVKLVLKSKFLNFCQLFIGSSGIYIYIYIYIWKKNPEYIKNLHYGLFPMESRG